MMGTNYGAIDHVEPIGHGPAFIKSLQYLLPLSRQRPASKLALNG